MAVGKAAGNSGMVVARIADDNSTVVELDSHPSNNKCLDIHPKPPQRVIPLTLPAEWPQDVQSSSYWDVPQLHQGHARWSGYARPFEDGGGLPSQGKLPHHMRRISARAVAVRSVLWKNVLEMKLAQRLLSHLAAPSDAPLVSQVEADQVAHDLGCTLQTWGYSCDLGIGPGQPLRLGLLQALAAALGDLDAGYCNLLREGVPVFDFSAPGVFEERQAEVDDQADLCDGNYVGEAGNYGSVEINSQLAWEKLQDRLSKKFVDGPFSKEELFQMFPRHGTGKLAAILEDPEAGKLRLVYHPAQQNEATVLRHKPRYASAKDARAIMGEKGSSDLWLAKIDVKDAHHIIRQRIEDQGIFMFEWDQAVGVRGWYRWTRLPFGARSTSAWWDRLGALLVRIQVAVLSWDHLPSWVLRIADDFLLFLHKDLMPHAALIPVLLLCALGFPLSWKKLHVGWKAMWVGFEFNMRELRIWWDASKIQVVQLLLQDLGKHRGRLRPRQLARIASRLAWLCGVAEYLKPFLAGFWRLQRPLRDGSLTLYGIPTMLRDDVAMWTDILETALCHCPMEARRAGSMRPVSDASCVSMHGRIGGFIHPGHACAVSEVWWWTFPVDADAEAWLFDRKDSRCSTAAIELLGILVALKLVMGRGFSSFEADFYVEAWTDSEAAARASRRWYSSRPPMLRILREMAVVCWKTQSEIWLKHVPGKKNVWADFLSRHAEPDIRRAGFDPGKQLHIDLRSPAFWTLPFDLTHWLAEWERRHEARC